jgi:hypothetical protein
MSPQFDWNKQRRNRGGWGSEIWPFSSIRSKTTTSQQPSRWNVEPSAYVSEGKIVAIDEPSTEDLEFEQQKAAFKKIPPLILAQYQGQFVASRNGEIVDSDKTLAVLTRRIFAVSEDVAVYITKIGEPVHVTISTPLP